METLRRAEGRDESFDEGCRSHAFHLAVEFQDEAMVQRGHRHASQIVDGPE